MNLPFVLPNGELNPVVLKAGPSRPLTGREDVIATIVAECIVRGNEALDKGHHREALLEFEAALDLLPGNPIAEFNRGQALLALGDYHAGFEAFEWRFKLQNDILANSGIPVWRGELLDGKHILVSHEHGLGDGIMMMRYVNVLKQLGAAVTMTVPQPLVRLAQQLGVDVRGDWLNVNLLDYDYRTCTFSPMAVLRHRPEQIPKPPYLFAEPSNRVPEGCIGIAWSGNRDHKRDAHRSIPIEDFLRMFDSRERKLFSVQTKETEGAALNGVNAPAYEDFAELAGCMMRMKHVVCVDTAAIHLAGALGHPSAHVLLPFASDWRWYRGKDWYPELNMHWQDRPGDWPSAFRKLNEALCRADNDQQ